MANKAPATGMANKPVSTLPGKCQSGSLVKERATPLRTANMLVPAPNLVFIFFPVKNDVCYVISGMGVCL